MPGRELTCLERATKLLALRALSTAQLRKKLADSYTEAEIESVVTTLTQMKALDDVRFAALEQEKLQAKFGDQRVAEELSLKGLAVNEDISTSELDRAQRIAKKKLSGKSTPGAISRYLWSRGFSEDTVETVISRLFETQ